MVGKSPDNGGNNKLEIGNQAGGQQDGTNLCTVSKLHHCGDEADDQCGKKFISIVLKRISQIPNEETKVEGQGKEDKESKKDFFEIHNITP